MSRSIIPVKTFFALSCAIIPEIAFAYLDPGTTSIILQGIIAAIVGATVVVKTYWYRLKALWVKFFYKSQKEEKSSKEESEEKSSDRS